MEASSSSTAMSLSNDATHCVMDKPQEDTTHCGARVIANGNISLDPRLHVFTVAGTMEPRVVRLFPATSCSCPTSSQCYHVLAAKMAIGLQDNGEPTRCINLMQLHCIKCYVLYVTPSEYVDSFFSHVIRPMLSAIINGILTSMSTSAVGTVGAGTGCMSRYRPIGTKRVLSHFYVSPFIHTFASTFALPTFAFYTYLLKHFRVLYQPLSIQLLLLLDVDVELM